MARTAWYRLDNVGKFYSSQAGSSAQTVFRYAATMADDVDPAALQRALDRTAEMFPGFNVCLRSGMFWHYLEQAPQPPAVHEENLPICYGLHVDAKSVLIRVSYYRARINLEVSHMVSDGRGSLSFFKALLYAYVEERYGVEGLPQEYDGSDHQKAEDSFDKYFERDKAAPTRAPKVYRLTGWRDAADPTYLEYHLPVRPVLDLARGHGVSLTSLVIAAIMCAIRAEMPRRERHRAILRRAFHIFTGTVQIICAFFIGYIFFIVTRQHADQSPDVFQDLFLCADTIHQSRVLTLVPGGSSVTFFCRISRDRIGRADKDLTLVLLHKREIRQGWNQGQAASAVTEHRRDLGDHSRGHSLSAVQPSKGFQRICGLLEP